MRSDTRRNRRRLLQAVGELARESPDQLTMQAIASRAEVCSATAYRYYSSVQDAVAAYVLSVAKELRDFSLASNAKGQPLFDAVVDKWVDLLAEHGPALVQLRAQEGFLRRLQQGNEITVALRDAWHRPVRELLEELGLPAEMLKYALLLKNMIFNPREVQDLLREPDLSRREVIVRLTEAYRGALLGWARAG